MKNVNQTNMPILEKVSDWTFKNVKLIFVVFVALVTVGAGVTAYSQMQKSKENEVQAELSLVESKYDQKKSDFEKQRNDARIKAKDPKSKEQALVIPPDYSNEIEGYKKVISKYPKTDGARLATLSLSDILVETKKYEEALSLLEKASTTKSDVLSGLLLLQLGTVQAELGNCDGAITNWQRITGKSELDFLHGATKLKLGTCYEKKNDMARAESYYNDAKLSNQEGVSATADRYLKLMKFSN